MLYGVAKTRDEGRIYMQWLKSQKGELTYDNIKKEFFLYINRPPNR